MRRSTAALLSSIALLSSGCSFTEDLKTSAGRPDPACVRDVWVAERSRPPQAALPEGRAASLLDLLRLVDDGSVELQVARARAQEASAAVARARADLLPSLGIAVGAQGLARPPGTSGFRSDQAVLDAIVELSAPLDVSGRLAAIVRAAQARYRAEAQRVRAVGLDRRLTVGQAYFTLLEAIDLARVNEAAVLVQERALRDGQARLDAGVVRKNDVLVIEVALSNSRQRGVTLASVVREARRALNVATGLPVDHATIVEPFPDLIAGDDDVVALLERARYENPDVDVLVETRAALLRELFANSRGDWPEISVGPRVAGTTERLTDPSANFSGFIAASWNPDLNGRLRADRGAISARIVEVAWSLTGLLRRLEQEILRSHDRVLERTSALAAARTSVGQARENLRIVLEQFRSGIATGREVLEAQALVSQQEGTLDTSRHQANAAQIELHALAGRDPMDFVEAAAARAAASRAAVP